MRWVWVLLVAGLAGCVERTDEFGMGGSFEEERSEEDIEEVKRLGEEHGGDVTILESSDDFRITGLDEDECEALAETLREKDYAAEVFPCDVRDTGPY